MKEIVHNHFRLKKGAKQMKKILITALLSSLIAGAAFADNSNVVSSANVVGYVEDVCPSGFHISGMQFYNETNTPETVYGDTLPKGSKVYMFNGTDYVTAEYTDVFVPGTGLVTKWDTALDLSLGSGYWVDVPSTTNTILSGDVPLDDTITNSIIEGFQLLSYPYPTDRVVSNLGFSPAKNDKIYVFDGTDYKTSKYTDVFVPGTGLVTKWDDETLAIPVGQGFWYETTNITSWIVNRPFDK